MITATTTTTTTTMMMMIMMMMVKMMVTIMTVVMMMVVVVMMAVMTHPSELECDAGGVHLARDAEVAHGRSGQQGDAVEQATGHTTANQNMSMTLIIKN